ncbi:MAG: ABC-F family ATP-binding cassette domain-containing protein [Acidimicrobiaceae bacterium]|nr:ABC-F family ATP-binding cassette domain-containing protein [Acidimicrobiaceae bacterium]MBT5580489.1 ABC-F family ATP-binding cassette domain-containing protein [Acidimicrobiaceae bacterium]MBT5850347.1 ABC-F family ATP-binding cassette domain-containing protein [Acidimicrobiaceae bacterium]
MILVDIDNVSMSRPNRPLFSDVSVTISSGDRLGVVGINGTGKSTLLSIIAGTRESEGGSVRRGRGVTIAAVDQVTTLPAGTVRDAVGAGWRGEAALDRLGLGGILDQSTDTLSGGQEKRVALARALVADADLLILDEPTNHLDVDAIEWLETELRAFRGGLVVVTHDRHVLDSVSSRILELDRGASFVHEGGYDGYLEGRAAREERAAAHESTRRNLARTELAWLRTGAKARTRKSKSRIERANVLIAGGPQAAAREGDLDLAQLHSGTPRLGDQVVELHDVSIGFEGLAPLVEDLDLLIDRRERLGIVGANGSGKSTLLDVIAGRRDPIAGRRVEGPTVSVGLHDQQGRDLDPKLRVRQAIAGEGAEPDWWDVALLERFWFDKDVQKAPIELLSGGERRRLQLVLTLSEKPNVLLLDEPTNDLDLDTLRSLEDFLDDWPGAVIVISHDRTFLERTVDDVLVIDKGRAQRWPGGYAGWLEDRQSTSVGSAAKRGVVGPAVTKTAATASIETAATAPVPAHRSRSTVRHELKTVEREVLKVEKAVERLRVGLVDASADHEALAKVGADLTVREQELNGLEERWLELSAEIEEIDAQ